MFAVQGHDVEVRFWTSNIGDRIQKCNKCCRYFPKVSKSSLGLHRESATIGQAEAKLRVGLNPTSVPTGPFMDSQPQGRYGCRRMKPSQFIWANRKIGNPGPKENFLNIIEWMLWVPNLLSPRGVFQGVVVKSHYGGKRMRTRKLQNLIWGTLLECPSFYIKFLMHQCRVTSPRRKKPEWETV